MKTQTIFGMTFVSKADERELSKEQLLMLKFHEEFHRSRPLKLGTKQEELKALLYSIKKMREKGYSIKKCIDLEIDFRLYDKYGLDLQDLKDILKVEK